MHRYRNTVNMHFTGMEMQLTCSIYFQARLTPSFLVSQFWDLGYFYLYNSFAINLLIHIQFQLKTIIFLEMLFKGKLSVLVIAVRILENILSLTYEENCKLLVILGFSFFLLRKHAMVIYGDIFLYPFWTCLQTASYLVQGKFESKWLFPILLIHLDSPYRRETGYKDNSYIKKKSNQVFGIPLHTKSLRLINELKKNLHKNKEQPTNPSAPHHSADYGIWDIFTFVIILPLIH